jgi:hypothetical protein
LPKGLRVRFPLWLSQVRWRNGIRDRKKEHCPFNE